MHFRFLAIAALISSFVSAAAAVEPQRSNFGPACSIAGANNCQPFDDSTIARPSDLTCPGGGARAADDFRPLSTTINSVCVWGAYLGPEENGSLIDCADTVEAGFHVTVYANSSALPNFSAVVGQSAVSAANVTRVYVPATDYEQLTQSRVFSYQLTLDIPIAGLDPSGNTTYWIEVTNDTVLPDDNGCFWNWISADTVHNDYSVAGTGAGYGQLAPRTTDMAFCLDTDFQASPAPQRACCDCVTGCSVQTLANCQAAGDRWLAQFASCTGNPCGPGGPPANDNCAAVAAGPDSSGEFVFSNRCATTDGPNPVPSELNAGGETMASDVWYKFVLDFPTTCGGAIFATCGTGAGADLDSFVAVYHDPNNPTECVCPDENNQSSLLWPAGLGDNDGCAGFPLGTGGVLTDEVVDGGCFMVRVGGVAGDGHAIGEGIVTLLEFAKRSLCTISLTFGDDRCAGGANQDQPCARHLDCPGGRCHTKSRYISTTLPSTACCTTIAPYVIQVTAVSLPGSLGTLNGDIWYAGAPVIQLEGPPGGTFKAAPLQCGTAALRDWSVDGLVHLHGPIIVPGATYELRMCTQVGGSCSEPPLIVQTAAFGDVVPPVGISQPNFLDIAAIVDKFQGKPGAISKTRAQLQPNILNPAANVSFLDISAGVDAFKGMPYPFPGAPCPEGQRERAATADRQPAP